MLNTVRSFAIRWLLEPMKKSEGITLIIRKTDGSGNFVPGARLELDFNDNINADRVIVSGAEDIVVYINDTTSALDIQTGSEPITIDELLPGRYYLYEYVTPNGYKKADSMGFTINPDGSVTPNYTSETVVISGNNFEIINIPKRTISFIACWIDNPTSVPTDYSTHDYYEQYVRVYDESGHSEETDEVERRFDDYYEYSQSKLLAIKIYDDNEYIGYWTVFGVSEHFTVFGTTMTGPVRNYGYALSGTLKTHIKHAYTRLDHLCSSLYHKYVSEEGCPYNPLPYSDGLGYTDDEGYYGSVENYVETNERQITSANGFGSQYRYIPVTCSREITKEYDLVNVAKWENNHVTEWGPQKSKVSLSSTLSDTVEIPLDMSYYGDYKNFDAYDPGNPEGTYVYYGDGMTETVLADYLSICRTYSSADMVVKLSYNNEED